MVYSLLAEITVYKRMWLNLEEERLFRLSSCFQGLWGAEASAAQVKSDHLSPEGLCWPHATLGVLLQIPWRPSLSPQVVFQLMKFCSLGISLGRMDLLHYLEHKHPLLSSKAAIPGSPSLSWPPPRALPVGDIGLPGAILYPSLSIFLLHKKMIAHDVPQRRRSKGYSKQLSQQPLKLKAIGSFISD